tara:strand:+ start:338 stop:556 length:219 start_codon:yes stop_codon:yes gene_type:complete
MKIDEMINEKDRDQLLIEQAFKTLEELGYVIVGNHSYIQAVNGILCVHPVNRDYLANTVVAKIKEDNLKSGN